MPDAIFAHPRLAAVYDVFDGDRGDLAAYRAIVAGLGARHVVDVGCGTGELALLLAADGLLVTGVDPAEASLDVARAKPGAQQVTWICGDATGLPALGADLAVMTGNVAQVFLSDEAWTATLDGITAALRPGGHFVFETRRPEAEAWQQWAAEPAEVVIGGVRRRFEVTAVSLPLVTFRYEYTFADGEQVSSESTLRFRDRAEVEQSLTACGYDVLDVREAPDRPGLEFVFLARARR
jgi:SAM-dependent methyltransferase